MNNSQITEIAFNNAPIKYYRLAKDSYSQDIIPGVYEGGFKVWQCTIDMLNFIANKYQIFKGKTVMDLGCGHGLLGIAALKLGASKCIFQDYNADVLENITIPNIKLNEVTADTFQILSGDWNNIPIGLNNCLDIIIGSQVIYRQQNYIKIVNLCKNTLKHDGIAVLANKHYYFGVGGNMAGFKQHINKQGLIWQSLQKIVPQKGGNKKQIISICLNKQQA